MRIWGIVKPVTRLRRMYEWLRGFKSACLRLVGILIVVVVSFDGRFGFALEFGVPRKAGCWGQGKGNPL